MESILHTLNEYSGLLSLIAVIVAIASYIVAKRGERSLG